VWNAPFPDISRFLTENSAKNSELKLTRVQQWRRSGKKERQGATQKTIKFESFTPIERMLMYFFFLLYLTLFMTKLRILVLSFPDFTDISIILFLVINFLLTI
jgi:hypothetical protein